MDPIPPINKVFSLVSQDEKHKTVISQNIAGSNDPVHTMAFAVRNDGAKKLSFDTSNPGYTKGQRKDRLYCTHCHFYGHTADKCYKLHGYPRTTNQEWNLQLLLLIKSLIRLSLIKWVPQQKTPLATLVLNSIIN